MRARGLLSKMRAFKRVAYQGEATAKRPVSELSEQAGSAILARRGHQVTNESDTTKKFKINHTKKL